MKKLLLLFVLALPMLALPRHVPADLYDNVFLVEVERADKSEWTPMLGAQIDTESAWRPEARSRFAAGLAQFTPPTWGDIAPRTDPSCADKPETDPGCSVRAQIVYMRALLNTNTCRSFHDARDRWACAWCAFNGGLGWVIKEVRACQEEVGCDPSRWFHEVERVRVRALWAWRENREYPLKILKAIPGYS